jgi:hypothetical protein
MPAISYDFNILKYIYLSLKKGLFFEVEMGWKWCTKVYFQMNIRGHWCEKVNIGALE